MAKVKLVLVGAQSYTVMALGLDPILQGQGISVEAAMAANLQALYVVDAANGRREIFVPPDHPRALRYAKNAEAAKPKTVKKGPAPHPSTTRRRRAT